MSEPRQHPFRTRGWTQVGWAGAVTALLTATASAEVLPIDPPAPPGSTAPAIASEGATTVSRGHDVLMTWLEPDSGGRLRFARYSVGSWNEPVTIASQVSLLDPEDRPSLTVIDTQAVRRTLIARTGDVIARSGDAGRTWGRLPSAPLPFASFAGGDEGAYAFWLGANGDGAAKLLGTRVLAGESVLDPRTSGGSSTSAAMTWDGPVVVYRDAGAQGAQDVAVVRRQDARWTPSRPVHVGGWRPEQSPKAGPRVAAVRRHVAVVWYTGAARRPRLLAAFSDDAGRTFDDPVEIDAKDEDRAPLEPVDVTLDDEGRALVLWMTRAGTADATLRLASVAPGGDRGEELVLAKGLSSRLEGMPQVTRAGPRVAATWLDGASGRVRVVAVPLDAIPAPDDPRTEPAVASEDPMRPGVGRGRVGDLVPDLELVSLDGEKVSLASLRGQAVMVNLWATWCLPCIAEIPELAAIHAQYGKEGLVVVGVSVDEAGASDKVHAFVAEHGIPYAVWLDPDMRLFRSLRVRALPVTLVVDHKGVIVLRRDGRIEAGDAELSRALRRAIGSS